MTPNFFKFHIRILQVICCKSKKKCVGLEITGPYLFNNISINSELHILIRFIVEYRVKDGRCFKRESMLEKIVQQSMLFILTLNYLVL